MVLQMESPMGWVHGVPSKEGREWNLRWWTSKPAREKTISPFVVQTRGVATVLDWTIDLEDGTRAFRLDLSAR